MQDALNRWWWPAMMTFGPRDGQSQHSDSSMACKIKRFTNDALLRQFVDAMAPQSRVLGIEVPDPDLRWNEAMQHFSFGTIGWEEFRQALAGNGPCQRPSAQARRQRARRRRRDGAAGGAGMMFEPTASTIYRHPTFYDVPDYDVPDDAGHM